MEQSTSLWVRNVQEAYVRGLEMVRRHGRPEETRNGPALVVPWPVMTTYERPTERVLLDPARDANPFFHLLESMWMLAGRRDVASLEPFNAGLKRYSDDGEIYHGAYGYRWRQHFMLPSRRTSAPFDQLRLIIEMLRSNPQDRRAVLAMWDPEEDLGRDGLDFPCNTHVYFRVRHEDERPEYGLVGSDVSLSAGQKYLDITVCCRSNDAIWGAFGANAVHFSVMQELVAMAVGARVGRMHQLSSNLHAYQDVLEKVGEPRWPLSEEGPTRIFARCHDMPTEEIFRQIEAFWGGSNSVGRPEDRRDVFTSDGIQTLIMMRETYLAFKNRERDRARGLARDIPGDDWRRACVEWLERRRRATANERKAAEG